MVGFRGDGLHERRFVAGGCGQRVAGGFVVGFVGVGYRFDHGDVGVGACFDHGDVGRGYRFDHGHLIGDGRRFDHDGLRGGEGSYNDRGNFLAV